MEGFFFEAFFVRFSPLILYLQLIRTRFFPALAVLLPVQKMGLSVPTPPAGCGWRQDDEK